MEEAFLKLFVLTELLSDGMKGFQKLASGLVRKEHTLFCSEESCIRADYHAQLEHVMRRIYGEIPRGGTVPGRMHRGWIEMETTLGFSDHVLLGTAIHCEAVTVDYYKVVLRQPRMNEAICSLLTRQFQHIDHVHSKLKELHRESPAQVFQA